MAPPEIRPRRTNAVSLVDLTVAAIAEDDIKRQRIAATLARSGATNLMRYSRPHDLLADGESPAPDTIVLCWKRVGGEQANAVRRLRAAFPDTAIVAVAGSFTRAKVDAALANGLDALVAESEVEQCLGIAIEAAQRGQVSLPRDLCRRPATPMLSVREKQILGMVVMGFSNAEIAQKLFVAESTVKSHLSSAFGRLGVRSRNEATAMILDPERGLGQGILTISANERPRRRR